MSAPDSVVKCRINEFIIIIFIIMAHWASADIAARYRAFRPTYPVKLFEHIAHAARASGALAASEQRPVSVLDVGCGSGQSILGMAAHCGWPSARFLGVDVSAAQLHEARAATAALFDGPTGLNAGRGRDYAATFAVADAGSPDFVLPHSGVDVVTVAQALHWIDVPTFAKALIAQSVPLLAVWFYPTCVVSPAPCNDILRAFDEMLLAGGHWPAQRWRIEEHYSQELSDLERAGFALVGTHVVADERQLPLNDFIAYLSTWSGVGKYIAATGRTDALDSEVRRPMEAALRREVAPSSMIGVRFSFHLFLFTAGRGRGRGSSL